MKNTLRFAMVVALLVTQRAYGQLGMFSKSSASS